ncbi:MAG: family F420-dependent class oxidoreductase [Frankiales bacterium]|jgi:probable F420-dependent oxidoreductase|nr:family F420-dependent class oxidoreductase [Frankiales bacterium]
MSNAELKLGFGLPVSGSWATRENVISIAGLAEDAGYESLWTFQRLLHPADADWGSMYRSVTDPLITLAYVAAITERARLGVAIVNAPYFSPILLAKQLTTLDELSSGRLDAGLGLGWAVEEFQASGVDFARRGARVEEFIRCLKVIWTEPEVSFHGEFYTIPAAIVDPKPVQKPHPPLLLGGDAEPALRRVGRLADGWISRSRQDLTKISRDIAIIKGAAEQAGRDPSRLRVVVRGVVELSDTTGDDASNRRPLHGTARQIKDDLSRLADQGVTEVFLDLNFVASVGDPKADPVASMQYGVKVLETFAPRAA